MTEPKINIKEKIEYPKDGVLSKVLFKEKKTNVTLFCMAGGTSISDHTSRMQGTVAVLEGLGEFVLEGESIRMEPGVVIYLDKDAVHSLKAVENTSFLLTLHD